MSAITSKENQIRNLKGLRSRFYGILENQAIELNNDDLHEAIANTSSAIASLGR